MWGSLRLAPIKYSACSSGNGAKFCNRLLCSAAGFKLLLSQLYVDQCACKLEFGTMGNFRQISVDLLVLAIATTCLVKSST